MRISLAAALFHPKCFQESVSLVKIPYTSLNAFLFFFFFSSSSVHCLSLLTPFRTLTHFPWLHNEYHRRHNGRYNEAAPCKSLHINELELKRTTNKSVHDKNTSNQWTPTANASMNKNIIFKLSLFNQFQFSTLYRFHSNTHYTHKHARSYFPFVFLMIDFLIGFSCNTIPTHCVYSVISRCILCIENDCQNE